MNTKEIQTSHRYPYKKIFDLVKTSPERWGWAPVELVMNKLPDNIKWLETALNKALNDEGILGRIAFFVVNTLDPRNDNTLQSLKAVPITIENRKRTTVSGLFFPDHPIINNRDAAELQARVNMIVYNTIQLMISKRSNNQASKPNTNSERKRESRPKTNHELSVMRSYTLQVVTPSLCIFWQENGDIVDIPDTLKRRVERYGPDLNREKSFDGASVEFLKESYLPTLIQGLKDLLANGYLPSNITLLTSNGKSAFSKLTGKNGNLMHLSFSATYYLNGVDHKKHLKELMRKINEQTGCSLVLDHVFPLGDEFGPLDLIFLDLLGERGIREADDLNLSQMGVDFSSTNTRFSSRSTSKEQIPTCGCPIHKYHTVSRDTLALKLDWGTAELHHIVPRGLAYFALVVAFFKGIIDENTKPRELMLVLRSAKIQDLIGKQNWSLFYDEAKMTNFKNKGRSLMQKFDQAVNSPYNTVLLCQDCHDSIHPDNKFVREIAGFIQYANMEKLTEKELEQDDIIEQILAGKYKKYGPGHSKKCYYLLHQARQIIIGQGDLYHLTTPNPKLPELDTMDQMLSLARINADRYFESASEKIIEFLLRKENWGNFFSKENKPLIKNIRHASWKLITHLNHHGLFETWILAKKIYKTKGMFSANIQNNYLDLETSALFFEMVRIFNLKQPFVDN